MSDSEKTPGNLPEHPKGALVITLLYFTMVICGWCFMYFTLISRGATQ